MKMPKLKLVEPIVAKIVLGFSVFNLVVGAGLYTLAARTLNFFIVNDTFTEQFWGSLFFLNGLALLLAYTINNWKALRVLFFGGFTLNLFWIVALSVRQIEKFDTNIFLLIMFAMVTYLQFLGYLHFPENKKVE